MWRKEYSFASEVQVQQRQRSMYCMFGFVKPEKKKGGRK